jgi:hypothetical protein
MSMSDEQLEVMIAGLAEFENVFSDVQQLMAVMQTGGADQREVVSNRFQSVLPVVKEMFANIDTAPVPQPSGAKLRALAQTFGAIRIKTGPGGVEGLAKMLLQHSRNTLGVSLTAAQVKQIEGRIATLVAEIKAEAAKL